MSYVVELRKNETGEVRTYLYADAEWDETYRFMWLDGNYSCDCNRAHFFAEAGGEPDPDRPCGHKAFTAVAVLHDGIREALDDQA